MDHLLVALTWACYLYGGVFLSLVLLVLWYRLLDIVRPEKKDSSSAS